jgi:hypothetical protein
MSNPFNRLLDSISQLNVDTVSGLMYGDVVSVSPLAIKLDARNTLRESFLYLGQACRSYKVTMPHTHAYSGTTSAADQHSHSYGGETQDVTQESVEIEIFRPLQVGDKVLLLSFDNGQKYYVAERVT